MLLAATLTVACTASPALPDLQFSVELTPAVPVVGERAEVRVTAGGAGTAALAGASLDLEGHMTHPGMTPVVARLEPDGRETGRYRAVLSLTMAGEWVLLVSGRLADGRIVREVTGRVTALEE